MFTMSESTVIDFSDKSNPPPEDVEHAPYGWRWDGRSKLWVAKKSNGGRVPKEERTSPQVTVPPDDDVLRDPAPGWFGAEGTAPKAERKAVRVTARTKQDMTAAVGMVFAITGPAVMRIDPYCGAVVTEQMQDIANAVVPLLCQSETVVRFFTSDGKGSFMLWFALAVALWPVGTAVVQHHLTKSVTITEETDPETGETTLYANTVASSPSSVPPQNRVFSQYTAG